MNKEINPLVSIVIPVYNGSRYMREAIDSALAQTYGHVEVIVVNDGSNDADKTEQIALSYGDKIRYFSKPNGGVSTALNMGIENMRGEYFSWLSHDDVYYPEKIQMQMQSIVESDANDTIVYCGYELINEKSEKIGKMDPTLLYTDSQLNISLFPVLKALINGCALLIHKSHFARVGIFDADLRTTQDYFLWFAILRNARVRYIPNLLVKSRVHPQQSTYTIQNHLAECSELWIYMINNVTEEEMQEMSGSRLQFYREQLGVLRDTNYKEAISHIKNLYEDIVKGLRNAKISVIIPFKNRIALLLEAVKSVQAQTYQNFEIIAVDDNSDEDIEPFLEVASRDERIKYIKSTRKGASAARNLGISHAVGDYIAFLDSDDLFTPKKLRTQLDYMLDNGYAFSHTSYQRMTMNGTLLEVIDSAHMSGKVFPDILFWCPIATPTVMAERSVFNNYRYNEDYTIGEDVCLWIDISYQYHFGAIKSPLTRVRISETSAFQDVDKQYIGYITIIKHVLTHSEYTRHNREVAILLRNAADSMNMGSINADAPEITPHVALYKRFIRFGFKCLRKCAEVLRIKAVLKKNPLYKKLYMKGIIDKLSR